MKDVRGLLEARCGLAAGALNDHKKKVKEIFKTRVAELDETGQPSTPPPSAGAKQRNSGRKGEPGATKKRQAGLFTRTGFMKKARMLPVQLGDAKVNVPPKEFSTGSCGFFMSSKVPIQMFGERVMMQCTLNCTVIGSKEWQND